MKSIPKIYEPQIEDIYYFENLSDSNLNQLFSFSESSLKLILDSMNRCDTKATAQVPFILTMYGVYGVWIKNYLMINSLLKYAFYINTLLVLLIFSLSLACLWVRVYGTSPPISNILEWSRNEPNETLDKRLIPTILLKIAESEYENYKILRTKSRILKLSQGIIFLSINLILLSILFASV